MATPDWTVEGDKARSKPLSPFDVLKRNEQMPDWSLNSAPIQIRVGEGEDANDFFVYEGKLITHSDFFAAALGKPWKEASERLVQLPEENAKDFAIFVNFIYTGRLFVVGPKSENALEHESDLLRLQSMWILADRLQSMSLKDAVTDALCVSMDIIKCAPTKMHSGVFRASYGDSGLRRLLVDAAVHVWGMEHWTSACKSPELVDFWYDVGICFARRVKEGIATKPVFEQDHTAWCYYHDHGNDKACYRIIFTE